ncbi:hypothetical protein [Paenibacillus pinistramenti]|uniref:hypothetical protein n=1 Tax=Paenibacillus pinistramenti TaxID=1768003 RepID=UPI00110834B9|nr:hypothetical protein [Paenibacillus pinistramenti]
MKWEWLFILLLSSVLTLLNVLTVHQLHYSVPLFFIGICLLVWLSGRIVLSYMPNSIKKYHDFCLCFLVGFFSLNSILLFMFYIFPFSVRADLFCMATLVVIAALLSKQRIRDMEENAEPESRKMSLAALLVILSAVSLWMRTSVDAVEISGETTIIKPWVDSFFHASIISSITHAQGFSSMQHLLLANQPMPFYHFAMYILPSELSSLTPTTAYEVFNSFLTPMGMLLSGFGAYVIIRSFWGARAGIIAAAGVLTFPDASPLWFGNSWLSYHWLQFIAPGGFYGVALMCLAWMIMIIGCKEGRFLNIAISYTISVICITYKFHIFFANALVLWIFPSIFFTKVTVKIKVLWFTFCIFSYFFVIHYVQQFKEVPYISYDGSASASYTRFTIEQFQNAWMKKWFTTSMTPDHFSISTVYWYGLMAVMLFLGTLGILGAAYILIIVVLRKKISLVLALFPLIVIFNYLATSLTISYDAHLIGNKEELMHRPLVWAYFIVCIWVFGAIGYLLNNKMDRSRYLRYTLSTVMVLLLIISWNMAKDVQKGPAWGKDYNYLSYPTAYVGALEYIKEQSAQKDIVQDSHNDPDLMVTALSERQEYVSFYKDLGTPLQSDRIKEVESIMKWSDGVTIKNYFKSKGIKWYIVHQGDLLNWPPSLNKQIVYQQQGYKVYYFDN